MSADVNWIAIILAAVSTMIVGSIWYGPVFGKLWMKLANVKRDPDFTPARAVVMYTKTLLASLLTSIVLAYVIAAVHKGSADSYLSDAVFVGLMLWAGFTAARLFMHDSFEGRPTQLTALNMAHELITIIVMSGIIGLLPA